MSAVREGPALTPERGEIAGIDGFETGWIAAIESADGSTRLEHLASFDAVLRCGFERAIIDIPIGLTDRGPRACDLEARRRLRERRNSVFPAPLRAMLAAPDYATACDIRERIEGKRCSKQLFAILPKIREVDDLMTPALQERIREGHPELSFTLLAGAPMAHYKGTALGAADRMAAIERVFPDARRAIAKLGMPRAQVDALDAYALLWSARRWRARNEEVVPRDPELDARGLRVEMVA